MEEIQHRGQARQADFSGAIGVLIVEDQTMVREGLRALLESHNRLKVVGEADSGRKAVEMARSLDPDVVLMDIAMPSLNGLEATRQILKATPRTRVLVLSSYSGDEYVEKVIEAGAAGYLAKGAGRKQLVEAVLELHRGNSVFSPEIARRLLDRMRRGLGLETGVKGDTPALTEREQEVLQLIAEGSANKQIASELGISIKTVEKHRQRLMDKLNLHQTAGLTRYAMDHGIIESRAQIQYEIGT